MNSGLFGFILYGKQLSDELPYSLVRSMQALQKIRNISVSVLTLNNGSSNVHQVGILEMNACVISSAIGFIYRNDQEICNWKICKCKICEGQNEKNFGDNLICISQVQSLSKKKEVEFCLLVSECGCGLGFKDSEKSVILLHHKRLQAYFYASEENVLWHIILNSKSLMEFNTFFEFPESIEQSIVKGGRFFIKSDGTLNRH